MKNTLLLLFSQIQPFSFLKNIQFFLFFKFHKYKNIQKLNTFFIMISGEANPNLHKRNVYGQQGVHICSQKKALCLATVVFASLFGVSLIIAFGGPQNGKINFKM